MPSRVVAALLDVVALGFAVLAWVVISSGGLVYRLADIRIGLRSVDRPLIWLVVVVAVRLGVNRRAPLFGISLDQWRRSIRRGRQAVGRVSAAWTAISVPAGSEGFQLTLRPGAWMRLLSASLALAIGLGVVLQTQVRHPYSVPDHGDPLFSIWRIGWINHQLAVDPSHLFDGNIFYPDKLTLALSDPMILPALAAAPLASLGLHPVVVYNILLLAAFWLSGVATYLRVERLTGSARVAFLAGLMFAVYAYRFEHFSHLELQMTQWMPIGLLALHFFIATGGWWYAVALALAGVAQLYSSMYYAVFFLVYATVIGAGLLALHRPKVRRLVVPTLVAGALAALAALPLFRTFAEAEAAKGGGRTVEVVEQFSARPVDYLRVHKYSALWTPRLLPPVGERALFPGVAPVALAVIGLAPPFSGMRMVYAAALLVTYDASLGFNGLIYPYLHAWLSPVRGLRVPARFSVLVGLTLSIFSAFGALRIVRRCRSRTAEWLAVAAMATFIVVDAWPSLALEEVWKEPPAIYQYLPSDRPVVLAELPVIDDPGFNTRFMYFSLWHWRPMVNGYSGYFTSTYNALAPSLRQFPQGRSPEVLRTAGVTHVILNCGLGYAVPCEDMRQMMRGSPDLRIIRDTKWQGGQVELYELLPQRATSRGGS
jgi:hypothetical protein